MMVLLERWQAGERWWSQRWWSGEIWWVGRYGGLLVDFGLVDDGLVEADGDAFDQTPELTVGERVGCFDQSG